MISADTALLVLGWGVLAIWLGLLATRFWSCAENDDDAVRREPDSSDPNVWPRVVAVVPARNEVDVIDVTLRSLAAQTYPGPFHIILVDDNSDDGTGAIARAIASPRIEVVTGAPLAEGWTGKLWAVHQGIVRAGVPEYLWLTDADIAHAPDTLRHLVGIALAGAPGREAEGPRKLVSFMAHLSCATVPEKLLIPAFIYFFKMLYPFFWINRRGPVAGAAGGCVLVERRALAEAGGIGAIRGALIDDCTLGRLIKKRGPIWLGLSRRSVSVRPYEGTGAIARMIARSAYAQLRYNPALLVLTLVGLALVFGAAPGLAFGAEGTPQRLGILTTLVMLLSYGPVLGWYGRSWWQAITLPFVALFYAGCTVGSAVAHWRGRGGMWKGRAQAKKGNAGKENAGKENAT